MDKVKKWVVDLADPMLKAYINYGQRFGDGKRH